MEQQIKLTQQFSRVRFNNSPPTVHDPPPQLIVASPQKPIVARKIVEPPPKLNLEPPKYIDDSIAARVRARRLQSQTTVNKSITDQVARQQRKAAHAVLDQETGELFKYRRLLKHPRFKDVWNRSTADEFGRLAQGIGGRIKGMDTIQFIHKHEIPADRLKDITYIKFVCTVRTKKKDPYRTRATMGGNLINYPDDVSTPTATLLLIKIFLNSVISMKGAKFANADLANFYPMTPLKRPKYAKIKLTNIPEEVTKEYKLNEYVTPDGWVYIKVVRGMCGLPQA